MIVLLVIMIVSEMKVDALNQELQQVVELGGKKSVAAFAFSFMFNVLACQVTLVIHIVHISASGD